MFEGIRKICLKNAVDDPENAFNVTSNLNWDRYERQLLKLGMEIPYGGRVLDLGCGWGFIGPMLKELRGDLDITCVDIKIEDCWKKFRKFGVRYEYGDGTNLNFSDKTFDVVFTFGVLEHVPVEDQAQFLKEVRRVLKKGGKFFIFNLPNKYSFPEFMAKHMGIWYHDLKYSPSEAETLLTSHGFKLLDSKIEFLIPAQIERVNKPMAVVFNHTHVMVRKIDELLTSTPLKFFAQSIYLECVKV